MSSPHSADTVDQPVPWLSLAIPVRRGELAGLLLAFAYDWPDEPRISAFPGQRPADALDRALDAVTERYGERTTNVVAMQLECPRSNEAQ